MIKKFVPAVLLMLAVAACKPAPVAAPALGG